MGEEREGQREVTPPSWDRTSQGKGASWKGQSESTGSSVYNFVFSFGSIEKNPPLSKLTSTQKFPVLIGIRLDDKHR